MVQWCPLHSFLSQRQQGARLAVLWACSEEGKPVDVCGCAGCSWGLAALAGPRRFGEVVLIFYLNPRAEQNLRNEREGDNISWNQCECNVPVLVCSLKEWVHGKKGVVGCTWWSPFLTIHFLALFQSAQRLHCNESWVINKSIPMDCCPCCSPANGQAVLGRESVYPATYLSSSNAF